MVVDGFRRTVRSNRVYSSSIVLLHWCSSYCVLSSIAHRTATTTTTTKKQERRGEGHFIYCILYALLYTHSDTTTTIYPVLLRTVRVGVCFVLLVLSTCNSVSRSWIMTPPDKHYSTVLRTSLNPPFFLTVRTVQYLVETKTHVLLLQCSTEELLTYSTLYYWYSTLCSVCVSKTRVFSFLRWYVVCHTWHGVQSIDRTNKNCVIHWFPILNKSYYLSWQLVSFRTSSR